jgi:predicted metal-dependent phosphoesterase TrpH
MGTIPIQDGSPQPWAAPLDQPTGAEHLAKLEQNLAQFLAGAAPMPVPGEYVNNHIHTTYSFSPYTPSDAAYHAWRNGLITAGIMDHDSVSGAEEFIRAGEILKIATTVGFECRCRMTGTPFAARRVNNPDQMGVAYVACHGIPHQHLEEVNRWLAPYRERRNARNRKMLARINELVGQEALRLDFERDVVSLSMASEGGSVTERHLLYALAQRMISVYGKGRAILDFLVNQLGMPAEGKTKDTLLNAVSPYYSYGLLGVLKSSMVEKFYIDADDECPHISEFTGFARSIGAIPAYAYLGDVGDSVTGDKKTQAFEDAYLDELVPWLAQNGFVAITYMPTRNSPAQLRRIIALCEKYHLFQISGEDINSPTQSFLCPALIRPEYRHLILSTWALIGHEKAATEHREEGMFTEKAIGKWPNLGDRLAHYAALGRSNGKEGCI